VFKIGVEGGAKKLAFDGKYVWVTTDDTTKIYEIWATNTEDDGTLTEIPVSKDSSNVNFTRAVLEDGIERLDTEIVTFQEYGNGFMNYGEQTRLVSIVPGQTKGSYMSYGAGKMYIAIVPEGTMFTQIQEVDALSHKVTNTWHTPFGNLASDGNTVYTEENGIARVRIKMNSNLHYCDGKLWMVENYKEGGKSGLMKVWILNIADGTWSSQSFGGKVQKPRVSIGSCGNGFVYMTAFNSLAVLKYNASTTTFVGQIRGNAFPNALVGTPNQTMLVASYGGLISTLHSDDTFSHSLSSDDKSLTKVAYQDNDFCWVLSATGDFYRLQSDNSIIGTSFRRKTAEPAAPSVDSRLDALENPVTPKPPAPTPSPVFLEDYGIMLSMEDTESFSDDLGEMVGGCLDLSLNLLPRYTVPDNTQDLIITPPITYKRWNGSAMVNVLIEPRLCLLTSDTLSVINTSEVKFGFPRPEIKRSYLQIASKAMVSFGPSDYLGEKG
jgi:hypothetical protein